MSCDHLWTALEEIEGLGQLGVALIGSDKEGVVGCELARRLSHALHRHELRRVRRQTIELDATSVLAQPAVAIRFELMAGRVVDDQEEPRPLTQDSARVRLPTKWYLRDRSY